MEKETNYKYIVYCTTNLVNNMIYVGVHKTKNPTEFDGYIGNGIYITQPYTYKYGKTKFQQAVSEFGVKNFRRHTLAIFDDEMSAYDLEEEIVNEKFLKRNDVYNMILGGFTGVYTTYSIKTYQYDLNGNFVAEYNSILEASQKMNVDHSAIGHAIRKKQKSCNSFWSTDKLEKLDLSNYNLGKNHKIPVHLYTITGDFIQSFQSYSDCAKFTNTSQSQVRAAALLGTCLSKTYQCCLTYADTYDKAKSIYLKTRPVYKYGSNGVFIKEYSTQEEAERENPGSNITKFVKNKRVDKNGFMWALFKVPNYNDPNNRSNCKKKVGKYDINNNLVTIYDSATSAAKENGTSVWKVLAGTNKTHKQHIYKYIIN